MSPAASESPTDLYRRRARRLRHVYAADPAGLHRALGELSRSAHRRTTSACGFATSRQQAAKPQACLIDDTSLLRKHFAQRVAERISGPIVRYSDRQHLLREAARLGVGRFEANLIIAAAQYQAGGIERESAECSSRRCDASLLAAAVAVQGMILLVVWWIAF